MSAKKPNNKKKKENKKIFNFISKIKIEIKKDKKKYKLPDKGINDLFLFSNSL